MSFFGASASARLHMDLRERETVLRERLEEELQDSEVRSTLHRLRAVLCQLVCMRCTWIGDAMARNYALRDGLSTLRAHRRAAIEAARRDEEYAGWPKLVRVEPVRTREGGVLC